MNRPTFQLPSRRSVLALAAAGLVAFNEVSAQPVVGEGGARILAIENKVKVQRKGANAYLPGRTNDVLQLGDALSTGADCGAMLQIGDKARYRVDELTDIVLSSGGGAADRFQIELREGGFYLLNREKSDEHKFKTPVASGAILGTEVAVRLRMLKRLHNQGSCPFS